MRDTSRSPIYILTKIRLGNLLLGVILINEVSNADSDAILLFRGRLLTTKNF